MTEGEDKPLKYPLMFRACELVLVNKIDLLPHLDFDLERFLHNLDKVHPGRGRMLVSARTGEGVDGLRDWLAGPGPGGGDGVRSSPVEPRAPSSRICSSAGPANERFFEGEAERIARLCHGMAERFARGGRLLALGASPQSARTRATSPSSSFIR